MTYLILLIIVVAILVFYVVGLLIFTPYEEEDKYVLKILEYGYKLHFLARNQSMVLKFLIGDMAKTILTIVYFILKDRKYTESIETKTEDEDFQ